MSMRRCKTTSFILLFLGWNRNEWRRAKEACRAVWRIPKETGATKRGVGKYLLYT